MSLLWLLFASLSVVGSVAYTGGMKFGAPSMNTFGYVFVMNVIVLSLEFILCLIARYGFKVDVTQGINTNTIKFAVLTGFGAMMVDVCFFLAIRYGSVSSTQVFWTVGVIFVTAVLSAFFLGESISLTKAVGIVFGIVAVVLITKG